MSEQINSHRDLLVWQQAMDLAVAVHRSTRAWPREELYGLISQTRRAASSIPANIAEGYGRENRGSYVQFLRIGQGSLKELETFLEIAQRTDIGDDAAIQALLHQCQSVGKLLRLLIRKVGAE